MWIGVKCRPISASLLALECVDIDAHHSHFACNNTTPTHDAHTP
jgi:hypothetical protein